jgi:peptide/nickel transport system permease protein
MALEKRRHFLYPLPTHKSPPEAWPTGKPERRPLRSNWAAMVAAVMLAVILLLSLGAPLLTSVDPMAVDVTLQNQPPGLDHWAGTDAFGRDVWSRLLYGGRLTLGIALLATLVATLPGVSLGLLAGFYAGWVDGLISRLNDVLLTIPYLVLALGIVAMLGPGPVNVALGIGLAGIAGMVRVVRAAVIGVRRRPYVLAARAVGCTNHRIVLRHILPNVAGPIWVITTLQVGWAVLNVSALNFLGVGVPLGVPEWGAMLNEGRLYIYEAPWLAIAPGTLLTLTVLAVNLVGDGLRDAIDPLLKT